MNLRESLLCVDCEWLYADATSCPRCGSRVAFPVARAMNHGDSLAGLWSARRRRAQAAAPTATLVRALAR
jgi:hypothetical protein